MYYFLQTQSLKFMDKSCIKRWISELRKHGPRTVSGCYSAFRSAGVAKMDNPVRVPYITAYNRIVSSQYLQHKREIYFCKFIFNMVCTEVC
jgi:hypothetical protein